LTQAGFVHVQVMERDPSLNFQKEGYGLTLTYNPKGPLAALGVLETVAQADCPSRSHYLFRAKDGIPLGYFGNAFFRIPNDDFETSAYQLPRRGQGQRGNLRVPRKSLRRILYDKLVEEKSRLQQKHLHQQENLSAVQWNHKLVEFQWDASTQQYNLKFEIIRGCDEKEESLPRQISVRADLLIAADGIRSTVLQQIYITQNNRKESLPRKSMTFPSIYDSPSYFGLRPLGIRLILGIADFGPNSTFNDPDHPLQLLHERGFYTVDGQGRRLFTMPYQSSRFVQDPQSTKNRIMWQLSFPTTLTCAEKKWQQDPKSLKKIVLDTCQAWHRPVMDLIQATPIESIWTTDLMDRDPQRVYQELIVGGNNHLTKHRPPQYPRLMVVGDALHSMSPFKGQGANQALADGPLLAKWLLKSSVDAATTGWWRETLNRTVPIVQASQKAARELHFVSNGSVNDDGDDNDNAKNSCIINSLHGFAGVIPNAVPKLIQLLQREGIGAHLGRSLDWEIYQRIDANGWFHHQVYYEKNIPLEKQCQVHLHHCQQQALEYASSGNTEKLRQMSLLDHMTCSSIFSARDDHGRSCLHLAVWHNHFATAKWLLVELQCCTRAKDMDGKTALDYCSNSPSKIAHIFAVVTKEKKQEEDIYR
jgi:2-polyprenyl-6-methoxyphenol hydroxylase-like FAD-dependent oxidoreductase